MSGRITRKLEALLFGSVLAIGVMAPTDYLTETATAQITRGSRTETPAPPAVPTNQTSFGIPIEVHQHPERIAEFQLLVSQDRGQNWGLYQSRGPGEKEFVFQAERDGEYWFAMRTIDRNRQARPVGPPRPELVVAIDTQKPQLRLDAVVGQDGSIVTHWQAFDPTLRANSLTLKYRSTGGLLRRSGEWIELDTRDSDITKPGELQGELNWWPEVNSPALEISAEIRDAADNVTVVSRRLDIPKVARQLRPETPRTAMIPRDPFQEQRRISGDPDGVNWPSETENANRNSQPNAQIGTPNQIGNENSRVPTQGNSQLARGNSQRTQGGMQQVTASTHPRSSSPIAHDPSEESQQSLAARTPDAGDSFTPPNPVDSNASPSARPLQSPYQFASQPSSDQVIRNEHSLDTEQQNPYVPSTVDQSPRIDTSDIGATHEHQPETNLPPTDRIPSSDSGPSVAPLRQVPVEEIPHGTRTPTPTAPLEQVNLPPGENALLTNRRQFRLTYEIDAVHPESVEEVELWMTRDGGNRWESWATDPDRLSPFPVTVPDEGIYGFKIVVSSREGFAGQRPQAGDLADIWVDVDQTRPIAEIRSAPLGRGPQAGKLVIQWQASDRKLSARPISLYYSESPEGPWNVIAAGLENSGHYPWRIDSQIPKLIYLRVEAHDRAGNTTVSDYTTPVDLRPLNPTGRIKGFDDTPVENSRSAAKIAPFRMTR